MTSTTSELRLNKKFWIGFGALLLLFLFFCINQWTTPAIEDEVLHHRCKLIWLDKGADWCELAHTPLYHEATSIWQKVFGRANPDNPDNIKILRSFSVFSSLITIAVFLWGLTLQGAKALRLTTSPLLVLAILILHPYFIQNSLHIDYDATILVPPLLIATILIEHWDRRERASWFLACVIALFLAIGFFAKEITPLIAVLIWPGWTLLRYWRARDRKFIHHTFQSLFGGVLSLVLFYGMLQAWAHYRGFHWYDPLLLTHEKLFGRANNGYFFPWHHWGVSRYLFLSYIPLLWLGAPLYFTLWASRSRTRRLESGWFAKIPFSIWFGIGIYAAYTWLVQAGFYYPKYTPPAWPILLYGMASYLNESGTLDLSHFQNRKWIIITLFALLFTLGYVEFFDPLLIIEDRTSINLHTISKHVLGLSLPVGLLALISRYTRRSGSLGLIIGLLIYFIGVDASHLTRPYSTRYMYGEHGFQETLSEIRKLKSKYSPTTPVLSAARDIDWALQKDSAFLDFLRMNPSQTLDHFQIIVSRTYGNDAVTSYPEWREPIEKAFNCHKFIDTKGQRFEWWWKNLNGKCD